jgi:MFS family permease
MSGGIHMEDRKTVKFVMLPVIMLSLAIAIRQMSMTIVMPFISTYCETLIGYTPILAGTALGIFGLMQAVFQIPFGVLSDRFGNKKMVMIGLIQVIVGLVIAFFAKNIYVLILARALQGSGAIIGVAYSWTAGMVETDKRTTALSILGAFVSVAAALAFAVGPLLRGFMPVNWMFLVCAILLTCNGLYILFFLKDSKTQESGKIPQRDDIKVLLGNRSFIVMNLAAFINNFMMISVFFGVPIYLDSVTGQNGMWKVFVPAILVAVVLMRTAIKFADKGHGRPVILATFLLSSLSILFFYNKSSYLFLLLGMSLFMGGYISIATLTATNVNSFVDDRCRGTANGIFNSFQ